MSEKALTYSQHEEVAKILLRGELLSLLEAPTISSQAVQETVKSLSKDYQVDVFLSNAEELRLTICSINENNCGKIDLTNFNQQVMRLYEELLLIFSETQKHSQTATTALIGTFEYLLSGLPDIALKSLDTVKLMQEEIRYSILIVIRKLESSYSDSINIVYDEVTELIINEPDQNEMLQDIASKLETLQGCLKAINFSLKEMSKSSPCSSLKISHEQLRSRIKNDKRKLDFQRNKIWQSNPFKRIVFNSYKIWTAFCEVSKHCNDSIMNLYAGMRKELCTKGYI